ncbi:Uncharacterized protein Adt_11928 [Abeliophyllum distichum]|uniref:Uncharacterized protein n=1 Tax=Abeliophyllum distichum TaxID=126358 RepID=A0ABD1UP98_9LAMI
MKAIPVEKLSRPSIDESLVPTAMTISESLRWMKEIIEYLNNQVLSSDKQEAQKLRRRATKFVLQDEILYTKGLQPPLSMLFNTGSGSICNEGDTRRDSVVTTQDEWP